MSAVFVVSTLAALSGVIAQADDVVPLATPEVQWSALWPIIILGLGGIVLLTVASLVKGMKAPGANAGFTVLVALGTIIACVPVWQRVQDPERGPFSAVGGAIGIDGFSVLATGLIAIAVILAALLLDDYLRREDLDGAEMYALMLLSAAGGALMASANDLIVMFIGLEAVSIAVYVMAAMHRGRAESQEAGFKYFIVGAFSSAFFLYGIAMVYGATGSTNLVEIADFLATQVLLRNGVLLMGMAMLLVGFGFKISAVPFQGWTPDVYQGAPTPVTAYMGSAVKVGAFAGMVRVFYLAFNTYSVDWQPMVYALAVVTMIVGAGLAIVQTDVKRMLAYSSISHAGFILVALQAATPQGIEALVFYLVSYVFMVAGSFGIVTLVAGKGDAATSLDDFKGLSHRRAGLALTFTVFLLSQAGVPLTSGFFAKFYVIGAAVDARSYWLAIIAMVASVVAAVLYLKIIVSMYLSSDHDGDGDAATGPKVSIPLPAATAIGFALVATIGFGLFPGPLVELARDAVPVLMAQPLF